MTLHATLAAKISELPELYERGDESTARLLLGSGYLDSSYAPFKYDPTTAGLPDTTNSFGQARWQEMLGTLYTEDAPLRTNSPLGKAADDMNGETFNFSVLDAIIRNTPATP